MDNRIINYTSDWRESLSAYLKKTFPSYSNEYVDYCVEHSADRTPALLVINDNEEIVGCHLYYCTKALVNGEIIDTQWGHDTFLDEKYREEIGIDFLMKRKKTPTFGLGLTEANKKLHKMMKGVFLEGVYNHYTITPDVLFSPFQKIFHITPKIKDAKEIRVKDELFRRVYSAKEIDIPNGGFWYKDFNDIDFIRDAEFIDNRFLKCNIHNYRVYASKDSYFVIRRSSYRGFPAILLSDFRYNPANENSVCNIMRAVKRLARQSGYGIVFFVCGDKNVDQYFKGKLHFATPLDFVAFYKVTPTSSYSLTGGDSDSDFLKN